MPAAVSTNNSIKDRLSEAGVRKAAVIDDSFDLPDANELTSEIEEFCNHAQRNPDLGERIGGFGHQH